MTKRWCSTPRESLRRGDVLFHDFASGHDGGRSIGRHVSPAADRRAYPPHARSDRFGVQGTGRVGTRATVTGVKDARLTLLAGFTTLRNVGARGFSDVGVRDGINAGEIEGPRMLVSGPALGITEGHCDNNPLAYEYHSTSEGVADGPRAEREKSSTGRM